MLTRRHIAAGLGLSLIAQNALAQNALAQPAAPSISSEPVLILDASLDPDARLTVAVMLNGQGPFQFVIDSGADRSVLSVPLAERLGLAEGPKVLVHGVGGSQITRTARVAELKVGDARLLGADLPVLPLERVGADGLIGVDILEGRNVVMDFRRRKLEIRRSRPRYDFVRLPREVSVMADARLGRLTVADCRVSGVKALAFVDSGGGVSIGNMALSRAIATRRRNDDVRSARLLTASGVMTLGAFRIVPSLSLGELKLTNLPMAFADVHIFDVWGLNDRPALLLGADLLRLFERVELDFGAGRLRFRIGGATPLRILKV